MHLAVFPQTGHFMRLPVHQNQNMDVSGPKLELQVASGLDSLLMRSGVVNTARGVKT